jgi:hypothetical protein
MLRQFFLVRQWDGAWSLLAPTLIDSGLFLLASGVADWDPLEARWMRPDSNDYDVAERTFGALQFPQSSSAK